MYVHAQIGGLYQKTKASKFGLATVTALVCNCCIEYCSQKEEGAEAS